MTATGMRTRRASQEIARLEATIRRRETKLADDELAKTNYARRHRLEQAIVRARRQLERAHERHRMLDAEGLS